MISRGANIDYSIKFGAMRSIVFWVLITAKIFGRMYTGLSIVYCKN